MLYGQPVYLFGLLLCAQTTYRAGSFFRIRNSVRESFNTINIFKIYAPGHASRAPRLCVFCPAHLLKHIRDFGLDPKKARDCRERERGLRPFAVERHGREADGPQDQIRKGRKGRPKALGKTFGAEFSPGSKGAVACRFVLWARALGPRVLPRVLCCAPKARPEKPRTGASAS